MPYEPYLVGALAALQIVVENPTSEDQAWVWVSGILAVANIAQYAAAAWRTRQDLQRLAERDRLDERRQRAVEDLLRERDGLIRRLESLEGGRADERTS